MIDIMPIVAIGKQYIGGVWKNGFRWKTTP
jgi:hypothetical protein